MNENPIEQAAAWIEEARRADLLGYDTAIVATATADGRPSARAVILRGLDDRGFAFYTDTRSRKGRELAANPHAALVMHWPTLARQIRAEGPVEAVDGHEADGYFAGRPRGHQLASWASTQSEMLADRSLLEDRLAAVTREYDGRPVPRPPYWSGYRVVPEEVELWEGRPDRLHDRTRYRRTPGAGWEAATLYP